MTMMWSFARRRRATEVSIGQLYRKRDAALILWQVTNLYVGSDRMAYAIIVNVDDPTMSKTVARTMLERGREYILIEGGRAR